MPKKSSSKKQAKRASKPRAVAKIEPPTYITLPEIDAIRKSGLRPQVVGCFVHDKKILFVYKKEYDLWQFPQGGVDNGETVEKACDREMAEEVGEVFASKTVKGGVVGEDQIVFPNETQNTKALATDDGTPVFMRGKKYFFMALKAESPDFNVEETEFDDYRWLDYADALDLASSIYQSGKRRITLTALKILHEKGLI